MKSFKIMGLIITLLLLNFSFVFAVDPIADYSFDVDASDATGNFNATLVGDAAIVDDATRGKVLGLTETGYVSVPPAVAATMDNFSFTTWVDFNGSKDWAGIMGMGMAASGNWPYWDVHFKSDGSIRFYASVGQQWPPDGCSKMVDSFNFLDVDPGWYHFALTFKLNEEAIVYINGVAQTTVDWKEIQEFDVSPKLINPEVVNIGSDTFNQQTLSNTKIDDFKFFDVALTAEEVGAIFNPTNVEEEVSLISNYQLAQNYPNPFNPETTIEFDISESSKVKLSIFDINGQEIAVLVDDFRHAGTYSASFNGSNLTSGVYFYRLEANGQNTTKRMVLLK